MRKRIKSISVTGLQDTFNYSVNFNRDRDIAILIAPNGYGKTAFLSLLHLCLQMNLTEAAKSSFRDLTIDFEDRTRWVFEKTNAPIEHASTSTLKRSRQIPGRGLRPRDWVRFTSMDMRKKRGSELPNKLSIASIPPPILNRALDLTLPVVREEYGTFRDLRMGDFVDAYEIVRRYRDILRSSNEFKEELGKFAEVIEFDLISQHPSVFIETQRLLYTQSSADDRGKTSKLSEEIVRQAQSLAGVLKSTYSNYAEKSQSLDRSFPTRLVERAANPHTKDVAQLRLQLADIESRRAELSQAGILVEAEEIPVPDEDQLLESVADALSIYVSDSRQKLDTFNDILPKLSTFTSILKEKLKPKEIFVDRERGAYLRRGDTVIPLDKLSSGEKHQFVILFKLLFETLEDSIVLIDEPEISLHVIWQMEFLSDLRRAQRISGFQSIIATHSPQIFQGAEDLIIDFAEQSQ